MAANASPTAVMGNTYRDLIRHFYSTIVETKHGKLLLALWGTGTVTSLIAGVLKNIYYRNKRRQARNAKVQTAQTKAITETAKKARQSEFLKSLLMLVRIGFPSPLSKTSLHLLAYTFFLISRIVLTIKIARITGKLGKMVGARTFSKMFRLQAVFSLWCIPAAICNALLSYFQNELTLSLRERLTSHVHTVYMSNLIYYRAPNLGNKMDDVDQRTTQDLKKFCSSFSELYGNLLKPVFEVLLLSHTLGNLMGSRHLMGFFAFFVIAGQWLRFVMPPFAEFTAETQRLEGEFRSHHSRVTAHSEEIAFYGGGQTEKNILNRSFFSILKLSKLHHTLQFFMGILDSYLVKYGASMVAYSMLIPAVYLGKQGLANKSATHIMEYYLTSTQLFVALGAACRNLVLSYKRVQALNGLTIRIRELFDMLGERQKQQDISQMKMLAIDHPDRRGPVPPRAVEGEEISFEHVDLFSPTGHLLVRDLTFKVEKNTNVLISGPNGSGKSSLFRVLGGLWPLCSGTMVRPAIEKLFYIPQQPYLCPGTLRDQVTYPDMLNNHPNVAEIDKHLNELMELVNLTYLVEREGGWDTVREWGDVMSGGEKQRTAMARLFYHKPAFGILDECTSAVSVDVESKIYETCSKLGITIFTVSHRPQLMHHHNYMLKFDGQGNWEWHTIKPQEQPQQQETPSQDHQ